jgi:hypothetical protein
VESGGFCGSVSIQSISMSYGAYISQDLIRKAAPYQSGSHGDENLGYEISTENILPALSALNLNYDSWDSASAPLPQGTAYLQWLKKQLAQDRGIVQFVLCAGDEHNVAPDDEPPLVFDHIEPFFMIYSKHPLNDTTVYDDDIIVHGSDYTPDGSDNLGYFRSMDSLLDDTTMAGNCKDAVPQWKHNEMYPCIYETQAYATAITGIAGGEKFIPISLQVNSTAEPDFRVGEEVTVFEGTLIIIGGVKEGSSYTITRYDGVQEFAKRSVAYEYTVEIESDSDDFKWVDPHVFKTDGAVYYLVALN